MPNNQMTPQECKKVLEEELKQCNLRIGVLKNSPLKNQTLHLSTEQKRQQALSYALNLIQENEELKKDDNDEIRELRMAVKEGNKELDSKDKELAWWHMLVRREVSDKFPNLQEYVKSLQEDNKFLKEAIDASIKDTKFFESELKALREKMLEDVESGEVGE